MGYEPVRRVRGPTHAGGETNHPRPPIRGAPPSGGGVANQPTGPPLGGGEGGRPPPLWEGGVANQLTCPPSGGWEGRGFPSGRKCNK